MTPINHTGYNLMQDGMIELSRVEAHGMQIDVKRLDKTMDKLSDRLRTLERELKEDEEIWPRWRKRFGAKTKLSSHDQLGVILFDELKYECHARTEKGKPSTDAEALEKIDVPFVQKYSKYLKYDKALNTFLRGIKRETCNGRLHPFFNLHTVVTFRSSSDSPNFQNFPVRDPFIAKLIRSCFTASDGNVLVENDYAGIEVKIAACYHKDPTMLTYIHDVTKDMHRDMAAQLYMIPPEWVKENGKQHRYGAKNKFVFPEFYGDFYVACARALWQWMERAKLDAPGGISLKEHLRSKGIKSLGACDFEQKPKKGTFEKHVQEVENDFWNKRFGVYGKWKRKWYDAYLKSGGFDTLTGFRINGQFSRNQVVNYPVQGSAFHCLLWSLIEINRRLRKYKMRSRIAGQIHDSIIGDVRESELQDYLDLVRQVMTVDIKKAFKWIIVPLDIENEICAPGKSWFDKRQVVYENGIYTFTDDNKQKHIHSNVEDFMQAFSNLK